MLVAGSTPAAIRHRPIWLPTRQPPGPPSGSCPDVSPTLAANEALAARRRRGEQTLPLAFDEAGLPVPPLLRAALAGASAMNGYGPVAGLPALRAAAAGYWYRRGLPAEARSVVCGPAVSRCSMRCCWPSAAMSRYPGRAGSAMRHRPA